MRVSLEWLLIASACWLSTPLFGGSLFVGNGGSGEVMQFDDVTGAALNTLTVPGGSGFTGGLLVGSDGNLYLASQDDSHLPV